MTTLNSNNYLPASVAGGGRIASDAYRHSRALSDDFTGLEEGADRYQLLLLVKRAGKLAGFTPRMIQLLDYYLAFTRDVDWEEGSRPIVYQSLARTALDLGVSERQVQKLEAALFSAGSITWCDSGNHKRYGQRCSETGRLLFAFGVDLTPLAYLRAELEEKIAEKRLYDDAWMQTKREISSCRRELRGLLAEWAQRDDADPEILVWEQRYDEIAVQIRTHLDLAFLRRLLAQHQELMRALLQRMGVADASQRLASETPSSLIKTPKGSSRGEPECVHSQPTTHPSKDSCSRSDSGFQESVAEGPAPQGTALSAGLPHVTLAMALGAASERLRELLPVEPTWSDLVEGAYRLRHDAGVSQESWGEACGLLGRNGAAVCLLITDRARDREQNAVRQPAAYFRGMVERARRGELRLHNSLFGLLERR